MADDAEKPVPPPPLAPAPLRFRRIESARDVRRAAQRITNAVLAGRIPARSANAAIYALTLVQRSLEVELIEQRLEALEQRAAAQQPKGITYDAAT